MKQEPQAKTPPKKKKSNIVLRLLAFLLTAALVLGALALVVYRDRFNLDALKRWLAYRNLETSQSGQAAPFTHAGGDKLSLAYLDNGILLSSAGGTHYYSFSGEEYAQEVTALDNPILSSSGQTGVVYDAGGQSLFLFRGTEEVFSLSLEGHGDLLSARVNDAGWLAVTAQQSGYKGSVTVYNAEGKEVIQINLSSTFAVDAALSPDCKTVAVVTMDQSGGVFSSEVLFYPVDRTEPSARADLGSSIVLDLDYESDLLWVMGEDRLFTVAPDGSGQSCYALGRLHLKGCDLGGEGFALLLTGRYRAGNANQALVIGPDGSLLNSHDLLTPVLDYSGAGRYYALLTGSDLTIYDAQSGISAALEETLGARHLSLQEDGSALLADSQQAWLYIPN